MAGGVATSCRALAGTLKEKGCLKSGGREGPVEAACGQRKGREGKALYYNDSTPSITPKALMSLSGKAFENIDQAMA